MCVIAYVSERIYVYVCMCERVCAYVCLYIHVVFLVSVLHAK